MGVVYQARQTKLNRVVALKMILGGGHADGPERQRFRTEAEAIARLQHPNIVQIHEVGEHDGLPFFSLEFCAGGSLDRKLAGTPLPPEEAAALVEKLARAMHAAHERGVIHRDLKPANVLLTEDGTPKITDFGLAKKLDEDTRTATGAVLGTPCYMAPEQAGGMTRELGPACDVYALGAILYECLTGRPPFKGATPLYTIVLVMRSQPVSVRQLNSQVPRDLETICLKCLHKEAAKRYASAADLAEDLRRFRAGEPIRARPAGNLERSWRWCRRNPVVALLLATVSVLVIAVAVVASIGYLETSQALERAAEQRAEAERLRQVAEGQRAAASLAAERTRRLLYAANMQLVAQTWEAPAGRTQVVADLLAEEIPRTGEPDLREFAWRHQWWLLHRAGVILADHGGALTRGAFAADGTLLTIDEKHHLRHWPPGQRKATLDLDLAGKTTLSQVALAADGKRVAVAPAGGPVRVLDAQTGQTLHTLSTSGKELTAVRFLADGRTLLTQEDDDTVQVWDADTGQLQETVPGAGGRLNPLLPLSPDGATGIARLGVARGMAQLTTWRTGKKPLTIKAGITVTAGAWSADGKTLALGDRAGTVSLWVTASGTTRFEKLPIHVGPVRCVAFSGDGTLVASGGDDGQVELRRAARGELVRRFKGHIGAVTFLGFSPDGQTLASGGEDRTARLWRWTGSQQDRLEHPAKVHGLAYTSDGRTLVSAAGRLVNIWDLEKGTRVRTLGPLKKSEIGINRLAVSADGTLLATGGVGAEVILWHGTTGARLRALPGPAREGKGKTTLGGNGLAFSPDGKYLAASYGLVAAADAGPHPMIVKVWKPQTGQEVCTLRAHDRLVRSLTFSPDGKWLATASRDGTVKLWRVGTWKAERQWTEEVPFSCVAFTPDSRLLAASGADGIVRVWDVLGGERRAFFPAHGQPTSSLAFSPDQRTLASGGADRLVKLWDTATWRVLRTLGHEAGVVAVAFSPDGNTLASATNDPIVRFWRAVPRSEIPAPRASALEEKGQGQR